MLGNSKVSSFDQISFLCLTRLGKNVNCFIVMPGGLDPNEIRKAPAQPTKLDFPLRDTSTKDADFSPERLSTTHAVLMQLKAPSKVSSAPLEALNIRLRRNVPPEDLVPPRGSMPLFEVAAEDRFEVIKNELQVDNEDAFRDVTRRPPRPDIPRVRLTQTRAFFSGLEHMAQYWDTSLDQYIDTVDDPAEASAPSSNSDSTRKYKGRRIGDGASMPEEHREETCRGFVQMVVWAFGYQIGAPSLAPRFLVQKTCFPVRQTYLVGRPPVDRALAKKGILEGPVLVISTREETSFRAEGQAVGEGIGDFCDLLRELGSLLTLGQQRARDGVPEVKPGEGQWWTTKPRWGGSSAAPDPPAGSGNSDVQSPSSPTPPSPTSNDSAKRQKTDSSGSTMSLTSRMPSRGPPRRYQTAGSREPQKRLTIQEKWKLMTPPSSIWDPKLRYKRIGKDEDCDFEDVSFFLSLSLPLTSSEY